MDGENPPRKDEGAGGGWIMTFADLMSLLMCFFVLLLSFAELDIMKFKAIAGSMKVAFGVQREIKAIEVPKGTSIIAQEFSSGTPEPTLINEVRQQTTDEDKQSLEFTDALVDDVDGKSPEESPGGNDGQETREEMQARLDAQRLIAALQNEIAGGMIEIETEGATIVIRIREKGSFPSGTAKFDPAFTPVIEKLRDALGDMSGMIAVAGHTDDIPIHTNLYRSNWDLSSARAVSVVHALLENSPLDPGRFVVEGHGDAHPLAANDTRENRALNRRVEITIRQITQSQSAPDEPAATTLADEADVEGLPIVPVALPNEALLEQQEMRAPARVPPVTVAKVPQTPQLPPATPQPSALEALLSPSQSKTSVKPASDASASTRAEAKQAPRRNGPELPIPAAVPIPARSPFGESALERSLPFPKSSPGGPPSRIDVIRDGMRTGSTQ